MTRGHNLTTTLHLTLKMTTAQVVKTSVTNNSLSKDYPHPDDHAKQIRAYGQLPVSPFCVILAVTYCRMLYVQVFFGHHCSQYNSIAESKIIFFKGCTKSRHSNVKPIEPEAPKTDNKALGLDEVS